MGQKFNTNYFLFLFAFLCFQHTVSAQVFSNEIHYDNFNIDFNEKIEVAGPAGTNLSGWSIVLYNGFDGGTYHTIALSGVLPGPTSGGCTVNGQNIGTLAFGPNLQVTAFQNGPPEGRARWTLSLISERLVELNCEQSVSTETLRKILKKVNLNLG